MILAGAIASIAVLAFFVLRNKPEEKGAGTAGERGQGRFRRAAGCGGRQREHLSNKTLYLLGSIYFLFGYTYVIYATFIVTTLVKERGFSEAVAGNFWAWVGFLSLFSGPVFGTLSTGSAERQA